MITGVIKNKIDKIWTDIWAGGITNPLTVIEQLTYLMFIRSIDEKELENEEFENMTGEQMPKIFPQSAAGQSMRWSKFKNNDPRQIYDVIAQRVFPAIKNLKYGRLPDFTEQGEIILIEDEAGRADDGNTAFARYMSDAMFLIPTPQVLQKIITGLEDLYEHDIAELDMQGDLYEHMLGKLATAGQNGQFRTPKHIREMMVELLQPTPDDTICDPACGTAGFLVSASEYIRRNYEDTMTSEQWEHFAGAAFTGYDTDRTMLRISAMNLMLHSISNPDVDYKDSVSKQNQISDRFTVVLANPPFKGTVDAESIHDNLKAVTNTKKTELLFLALFLRMLKKGGQCACIVPDGVLFGSSTAHKSIRKELVDNHQLRAVISMPSGVFKPYAGVSTAVLVFTKTGVGGTDQVWFYDMKADGFTLDDKRSEIAENDIPDIIQRFRALDQETSRQRTEQSFLVPRQEIVDNGYDLSINKYKKTEYVAVEYSERNTGNAHKPVAVGRYGIRTRESIYSKELAKDYSKNKLIHKNTLTVGMGSVQIDIGILTDDVTYSVSPAYHTYRIDGINADYLRYCLECRNQDMFVRFVKRGSRQGKTIDLKRWLTYEIPVRDDAEQQEIVAMLDRVSALIEQRQQQIEQIDALVKSRFIELFGEPDSNPLGWATEALEYHLDVVGGYAFKSDGFEDNGIPVLRIGNINSGRFLAVNMVYWPDDPALDRYKMYPGDLVMSLTGTVGFSVFISVQHFITRRWLSRIQVEHHTVSD